MKWQAHFKDGLLNLFSTKLRSILALLGILVGTASVVAMVSGGKLATNEALKQFKTLGTDLLAVSVNRDSDQENNFAPVTSLSLSDAIQAKIADSHILMSAPYVQVYNPTQYEGHELNGSVLGVTEDFAKIVHLEISKGRFISNLDGYAFYCVIGNSLYNTIKKYTFADPIGQQIQVGKNMFTIVGVANPWPENSFVYASIDSAILVPIMTSTILSKYADISNIIFRISPDADIDSVKNHIEQYLQQQVSGKRFFFRSAKELINSMTKQNEILTVFLGLIGSISLIVGGIGVMNIMLVSVIERRREIGIRLAVGATRADIRSLFLIEAMTLALTGGVLGVLIGILIAYIIAFFWHWEFTLFILPPVIGFGVSALVGVFFGFYPAVKASRLDPIAALRSDI